MNVAPMQTGCRDQPLATLTRFREPNQRKRKSVKRRREVCALILRPGVLAGAGADACRLPRGPRLATWLRAGERAVRGFATVIPGYTEYMKTAISLPDDTYEEATRQAAELGISRSEFFARAARRYLQELAERSLTDQINKALQAAADDSNAAAAAAGRARLAGLDDW